MSLFRKPKKIQRRMFCADDDEDGEPEAPPPPVISHNKKENKPVISTTLLSFADEGMGLFNLGDWHFFVTVDTLLAIIPTFCLTKPQFLFDIYSN